MPLVGLSHAETPKRWRPDPRTVELTAHFDRDQRFQAPYHKILGYQERFDQLTRKEWIAIEAEMRECVRDFEYSARNYFWITEKGVSGQARDVRFALWESQELLLETIHWLRSKGRAQKLIIIKARQLGCSSLVEGLVAWRTMFFPNIKALVVSYNDWHSGYLFNIMLHIHDMMPWWLKPMLATRKYEEGLHFENPNPEQRRINPGLNSSVTVQSASQNIGVATGITLTAAHISEFARWDEEKARSIIKGDLEWALADNPTTIAVLESTPEGSGTYAEDLWNACLQSGDDAKWYPVYLPWFFEATRFLAPEEGWKAQPPEEKMRARAFDDWVRCEGPKCFRFRVRHYRDEDRDGKPCPQCAAGTLRAYELTDSQLRWMQKERVAAEAEGPEAVKEVRKNLSSTAEQSFQLSGIQVFPEDTIEFVNTTVRKPMTVGNFDQRGIFHGLKQKDPRTGVWSCWAEGCTEDHSHEWEHPLQLWEFPDQNREVQYVVGVDVAEGFGGKHDYSVAFVNRLGYLANPDVSVAVYRINTVDPGSFAGIVNFLGRWYNDALMSIEYNNSCGGIVADRIQHFHMYPNLFRWKHYDAVGNYMSNRYHWFTNENSRPKLWQEAKKRLRQGIWIVKSANLLFEMKHFQKEREDSKRAEAVSNYHDDELFASCIALFTSHDLDYDPMAQGTTSEANQETGMLPVKDWRMRCLKCGLEWEADQPELEKCSRCRSIMVNGKPKSYRGLPTNTPFEEMGQVSVDAEGARAYDLL